MRHAILTLAALLSGGPTLLAQPTRLQEGESLTYSVSWSSGLPVGEARLEKYGDAVLERMVFNPVPG